MASAADTSTETDSKFAETKRAEAAQQREELRRAMQQMLNAGCGGSAVDTLLQIIESLQSDNLRLTIFANAAHRARFGRRSEKLTREELGQLVLALGGSEADAAAENPQVPVPAEQEEQAEIADASSKQKRKKNTHRGRKPLSPNLPRHVTIVAVPENERNCLHCGEAMKSIGHVDHERVEFIPARIEVHVERREKVACQQCQQDIAVAPRTGTQASNNDATAPGNDVRWRAGISVMAHLIESKCDDAMPVYRTRDQFARLGFDVPLNTLYGYWTAGVRLIQPVAQIVLSEVLGQDIVGVDDTRLDWLDPTQRSKRRRGHLWCFVGTGGLVAFEFTETWEADQVAPWINAIDGFIQCDDYKGYSAIMSDVDGGEHPLVPPDRRLGCWMHIRRPFHQAFKAGEKQAIIGLNHIRELYKIEDEAKAKGLSHEERGLLRAVKSVPIAEAFFAWAEERKKNALPTSYVGKAAGYAIAQKEFALRCLTDGRFELDTGRVERQIREPVVGRKNYLHSGSADAARLLAGAYTLVCSCRNLGINTREYLIDIMTKLRAGFPLRDINQLRPDVWAANRMNLTAHQMAK
jgi:transposase